MGGVDGRFLEKVNEAACVAGGLTFKRARRVTGKISAIITECRCAVAKVRHERAAMEGAEAAKRRQEQLEKEVREYHERDGRQMGSGGKQPLDQLLASGAAHQRCYVRRRKRVEDDRAKVAEEEARLNELRARLLPPLVPPPTPLAQALRRALVQLHRRPW